MRAQSPHTTSVYVSVVVSAMFLRGEEGQQLLKEADDVGNALMKRAKSDHDENEAGAILQYGWALVRRLHPTAPGPLKFWGRTKNAPPAGAPGVLQRPVLLCYPL